MTLTSCHHCLEMQGYKSSGRLPEELEVMSSCFHFGWSSLVAGRPSYLFDLS